MAIKKMQVTLSEEATTILLRHMRDAGVLSTEEAITAEMDELFAVADQVWTDRNPEMKKNIQILKLKTG